MAKSVIIQMYCFCQTVSCLHVALSACWSVPATQALTCSFAPSHVHGSHHLCLPITHWSVGVLIYWVTHTVTQGPACIPRGGPKGKRKAVQPEVGSAQQAKHVKHVLKRVGKEKVPSCPLCQSATTMACDKLEVMTLAELKLVMGWVLFVRYTTSSLSCQ